MGLSIRLVSIPLLASAVIAAGWLFAGEDPAPGEAPVPPAANAMPPAPQPGGQIPAAQPVKAQIPGAPVMEAAQPPAPATGGPPAISATPEQAGIPAPVAAPPPEAPSEPAPASTAMETGMAGQTQVPESAEAAPQHEAAPAPDAPGQDLKAGPEVDTRPPAVPAYRLQSLVDERRQRLRERRNAMLDAYGGPRGHMPPWFGAYDDAVERYRDARRSMYRQRRDFDRQRHTEWMDAICPWSKPQRDWSAQRSYRRQMEQLDRQELRDAYMGRPPFGFGGPPGW
jgi:hypothetical protein